MRYTDPLPIGSFRSTSVIVSALVCAVLAFSVVASTGTTDAWTVAQTPRRLALKRALPQLHDHAWAGSYYEGDGLGANILVELAPDIGVSATWHGCLGLYGQNEGSVLQRPDGGLHFAFTSPNKQGFGGFSEDLYPVAWGERHYLVASEDLMRFVNTINKGSEPRDGRWGTYLLRVGDEALPAAGSPALPAPYGDLIRATPVEFQVDRVEALPAVKQSYGCNLPYDLAFDTHGDPLLRNGVELVVVAADVWEDATVVSIDGGRAVARIKLYAKRDCTPDGPLPTTKWKLTTGALGYKRYAAEDCDDETTAGVVRE